MNVRIAIAVCAALTATPGSLHAQTAADRPSRGIEAAVGGGLLGGAGLGAADANLRGSDSTRQTFRLFATNSDFARAPLWHARVAFTLTRRLLFEGALTKSSPDVRVSVTSDAEGASPVRIAEKVDQYFIDGSLLIMLDELRMGARLVPFVAAGGGYLRQLHEGQTVVEQGEVYHAGGGFKYWLLTRRTGRVRTAGVRGDARAYLMRGGVSFDDHPRSHVAISGSVFVGF